MKSVLVSSFLSRENLTPRLASREPRWLVAVGLLGATLVGSAPFTPRSSSQEKSLEATVPAEQEGTLTAESAAWVSLSPPALAAAKIQVTQPVWQPFARSISWTGQIALNEDRLAHIFPIVSGQVDQVHVGLGQTVAEGEELVVVHSREVGQAKLDLYQARLQLELAQLKLELQQELSKNTTELLMVLRREEEIAHVQQLFAGRPMGDYRERLLQAYASYVKSEAEVGRLTSIADSGAIASKQLLLAQATRNADAATFAARLEQVEYELKTSLLQAQQQTREAETRVAVSQTNLKIMGCDEADIQNIDPVQQGEAVSDYAIRAPFGGTVIFKDVVLREQVRPDTQIMSIADLSTVWVEANVYEKDVPLLQSLKDRPIRIRNAAWSEREFEARIFYSGEIMDETTRTISMRAIADNSERLLKPGMFVSIDFSSAESEQPVLQVPANAILEHAGQSFVFVRRAPDKFERRPVVAGLSNGSMTVIQQGLVATDKVVISGGFILKSKLLESLMGEE